MRHEIAQKLNSVSGYRDSRLKVAEYIIENQSYFEELLISCFEISNPNSYKSCWVIEFVAFKKPEWFFNYLEVICQSLKLLTNESSIRPWAKIIQILIKFHYNKTESLVVFTDLQIQNCIEVNFDWLISETKVATKAYSMRTLFILGKEHHWIQPELQQIISKEYSNQSPAYKAVAREILKKLK